jgi:tRNA pseudouridine38-40 synthase
MPRVAIGLEYHGGRFAGWQSQPGLRTVQGVVEDALSRVAAQPIETTCAGRTDAGVHAVGQVAHFDTSARRAARGWVLGANANLPPDVSLTWAQEVAEGFHARHRALSRTYCYLILNRGVRSALCEGRAARIYQRLDAERMNEAARLLVGEHDFGAFRAAECQARTPVRRLESLSVERCGDWIAIRATANAFLHHMVRNLAGVLIEVGRGRAAPGWALEVLESRDRTRGAATAPADGLYLWSARYPPELALPGGTEAPWAMIPGLPRLGSSMGPADVLV